MASANCALHVHCMASFDATPCAACDPWLGPRAVLSQIQNGKGGDGIYQNGQPIPECPVGALTNHSPTSIPKQASHQADTSQLPCSYFALETRAHHGRLAAHGNAETPDPENTRP